MSKIIGTVGPSSEDFETLQNVVEEGLRVMRINFSHATFEEADLRIRRLRRCAGVHQQANLTYGGAPVGDTSYGANSFTDGDADEHVIGNLRAVLLDTQGPEIRTGKLQGDTGRTKITLTKGNSITLTTDVAFKDSCDAETLFVTYDGLCDSIATGSMVLLDDGAVELEVTSIDASAGTVQCRIANTGLLGSRKGVNLPGAQTTLPPMTEKDRADLVFGVSRDVDFVAASFVRKAQDVHAIRALLEEETRACFGPHHLPPLIISKIENSEGMDNFDAILEASDAIMVARGDLGVEIPVETVFAAQKDMILKCREQGKPVIVATQMLESMIKNPRPTRAEVSDVANAVLDGADCVMLSGECANGDYPVEAVKMMHSTLIEADKQVRMHHRLSCGADIELPVPEDASDKEVIAKAAVDAAKSFNTPLILVMSKSGHQARMVAKYRPSVPVMAFMTNPKVGRQLQLHRGIFPVCVSEEAAAEAFRDPSEAVQSAKTLGWCRTGDRVVVVYALPDSPCLEKTTTISVATVK